MFFIALSLNEIRVKSRIDFIAVDFEYQTMDNPEKTETELLAEKEALERELNEILKNMSHPSVNLPNIAVNQSGTGDKSGSEANASLKDMSVVADKSAKQENAPVENIEERTPDKDGVDEVNLPSKRNEKADGDEYKGPSILSYFLEGRHGIYMPVPAYKCRGGGDVVVLIDVNKQGYVTSVEIDKKRSNGDECVRDAAMQAALLSRFSPSPTGEANQKGNIVYRFIPQTN